MHVFVSRRYQKTIEFAHLVHLRDMNCAFSCHGRDICKRHDVTIEQVGAAVNKDQMNKSVGTFAGGKHKKVEQTLWAKLAQPF